MNDASPLFDATTHYRIAVRGQVDVEWLHSFDGSADIVVDETGQVEDITVIGMHTDQSGIVGLVRRLHGLGLTILQFQIVEQDGRPGQ